ncbi:MAG: DNA repair protein RadC [Acidobacteria bacterium]|nr:DNA repair protein RadC [Acidobacteriota bacterium]
MNQKRAPYSKTLSKAAEINNANNQLPLAFLPQSDSDILNNQPPKRLSAKYIPVYHIELVRDRTIKVESSHSIHNSDDVVAILRDELLNADREKLICLMLNAKNAVIGMDIVSVGSLTASIAHPREIFKSAILKNAASIILSHGHPSGDPTPSRDDALMTERVSKAGEILGIKLLDHVIIAEHGTFSFANAGRLP